LQVSALSKKLITLRFRTTKEAAEFLSFVSEVVDNVIVEQSGTSVKRARENPRFSAPSGPAATAPAGPTEALNSSPPEAQR
jgi:hypothetical protein